MMIKDGIGGANTQTGLVFENETDLVALLSKQKGYKIGRNGDGYVQVSFRGEAIGYIFKKHGLYKMLQNRGIDWHEYLSKKLLPDNSIYVIVKNTLYIIECKFQHIGGSTDEKLQTCDFKKKQYKKLLAPLNIDIEYIYVLSDWFKKPAYKDVFDYIVSVGCSYYFNYIPLERLNLPVPR
ncbi:MAG: hypothetical protein LBT92_01370 [Rickettsiales bacterium]|jgi:hypothetical protein|nr:hypothetical protein [Rickettsiales bacterium]